MRDKHEPEDAFVERLEWQITGEVRRRNRPAPAPAWWLPSRARTVAAALALVVVSMGVGGAVVAAAYQAQTNEQRDLLAASYARRIDLAQQRLGLAMELGQTAERKASMGIASGEDRLEARLKVAEAQSQLNSLKLQFEEVRLTGRDPVNDISAPLVGGRDFVSERLRAEMAATEVAVDVAKTRLRDAQTKFSVGVADRLALDVAQEQVTEVSVAVDAIHHKMDIRQHFVKGDIDAVQADLRVLEGEAEQRRQTIMPKLELAQKQLANLQQKLQVGAAQRVEVAEATLRVQQLNLDLAKANMDLELIRKRLSGK